MRIQKKLEKKAVDSSSVVISEASVRDADVAPVLQVGHEGGTEDKGALHQVSKPQLGHVFGRVSTLAPQTKLNISQPGDALEQEADRVADQITQMDSPLERSGEQPQHEPASTTTAQVLGSSGQALDADTRAYMEPRFGHDFRRVRVHADDQAASSAEALNARAYSVGTEVVFGRGQYSPETSEGRRLLAHELTHVVQQTGGRAGDDVGPRSEVQSSPVHIGRSSLAIQRAVHTLGGEWDTDRYAAINDGTQDIGVDIDLKFVAKDPVDATKIGLSQMVNSKDLGKPVALNPTVAGRSIPAGKPEEGSHIDRLKEKQNPIYGANNPPAGTTALGGSTTASNAQWGWHYTDSSGTKQHQDAHVIDAPQLPGRGANASQIFETTALATDGPQAGTYYGSVKWGWTSDSAGAFSKLALSVISAGVPSPTFMQAVELWNKTKTSTGASTLPLPVAGVTTGPDPKTLSTSRLAIRISEVVAEMGKLPPGPSTDRTNKEFEKAALETELASRADKPTISLEDHMKAAKLLPTRRLMERMPEIETELTPLAGGSDRTSKELEKYAVETELKTRSIKVTVHVLSTSDLLGRDEVYVKASMDGRSHQTGVQPIADHGVFDFAIPLSALLPTPFPAKGQFAIQVWEEDVLFDDIMADIKWPSPYSNFKSLFHPESGTNYEVTLDFA